MSFLRKRSMRWQGVGGQLHLDPDYQGPIAMSGNNPEFSKIIAKASRDPAFKPELIANPAAA